METISSAKSHGGIQGIYRHASTSCACDMTFAVFIPPQAKDGPVPVLWFLSGLTCTHANVMDKGEYREHAARLGVAIIAPDTSPRGDDVPDEPDNWQFGKGASFYVDATQAPWKTNYNMYSYIVEELPELIGKNFNVDMSRQGIFGHSMGGHGALTIALRNADRFKSCSAFAPIVEPTTADWSKGALDKLLGPNPIEQQAHDAVELVKFGATFPEFLIDQGDADGFLADGLRPWLFKDACAEKGIPLTLRMQPGYDHSYFFISTFMSDHLEWHAQRLA